MRKFLDRVYWDGRTHPKCGQHHPLGRSARLNKKENVSWAPAISHFASTADTRTSRHHGFSAVMGCPNQPEPEQALPSQVVFVRYSVAVSRKVTNTDAIAACISRCMEMNRKQCCNSHVDFISFEQASRSELSGLSSSSVFYSLRTYLLFATLSLFIRALPTFFVRTPFPPASHQHLVLGTGWGWGSDCTTSAAKVCYYWSVLETGQ